MVEQETEQKEDTPYYGGMELVSTKRSEMLEGIVWMSLGIAILIGSVLMDRLEAQDINPYTVPGLLPGLLGIAMFILGFFVFIRKWTRADTLPDEAPPLPYDKQKGRQRMFLVLGLCFVFCVGLLGRGFPFWLTGSSFVSLCVLLLDIPKANEQKYSSKKIIKALVIGSLAGIAITLFFEQIFMVRLP